MHIKISTIEKISVSMICRVIIVFIATVLVYELIGVRVVFAKDEAPQKSDENIARDVIENEKASADSETPKQANEKDELTQTLEPKIEVNINDDGTRTERSVSSQPDNAITITEKIYDPQGKYVQKNIFIRDTEGKDQFSVTYYDEQGQIIENPLIKTDDGKFIHVINKRWGTEKRVNMRYDTREVYFRHSSDKAVTFKALKDKFSISSGDISVRTALPIIIDDTNGDIFIETSDGVLELIRFLPHELPDFFVRNDLGQQFDKIDLIETVDQHSAYIAQIKQTKSIFGIYDVEVVFYVIVDVQTGDLREVKETPWVAFLGLLSR